MASIDRILIIQFLIALLIATSHAQSSWRKFRKIQYESKLDEFPDATYRCLNEGEKFVSDQDCRQYFKCKRIGLGFQAIPKFCPEDFVFDNQLKKCVKLFGNCPNVATEFPHIKLCDLPNKMYAYPDDCNRYFRCILHTNGNYYPEKLKCPENQTFHEHLQECQQGNCPQMYTPLPLEEGWTCEELGDFNVNPENCTKFYKCITCNDSLTDWCYQEHTCRNGTNYDNILKTCVDGDYCPQNLLVLPDSWYCENAGDLNADPADCRDYYECVECSLSASGWCYNPKTCPPGQFFDESVMTCLTLDACPLPLYWECTTPGEVYVHPELCDQYYTCFECDAPGGLCYELESCELGQFFDDSTKSCVESEACTNDLPDSRSLSNWRWGSAPSYYNRYRWG